MDVNALIRNQTDRLRGLDFLEFSSPEDHGFDSDLVFDSAPTGGGDLARVCRDLDIAPSARLLDIGCGRGSAIRTLLKFPFQKVDGLDVVPELVSPAQNNFRVLRERRTTIHLADATIFDGYGEYSHFYLANPFPGDVMARCLERILAAREPGSGPTTLIYLHPTYDSTIMNTGQFRRTDSGRLVIDKQVLIYRSL